MKKKIMGLTIAASLLITGVVSAASIWGTYKGNDVIRIINNGEALKTSDIPAISYNGKTMLPIDMIRQLGFGYTWDQKNKTIHLKKEASDNKESISSQNAEIIKIKNNVKYANFFHNLEVVGQTFEVIDNYYTFALDSINRNSPSTIETLKKVNESLNQGIISYNSIQKESALFSDADIPYILNDYFVAIDYFKQMDIYINKYYQDRSSGTLSLYLNNQKSAHENYDTGKKLSARKYSDYIFFATK